MTSAYSDHIVVVRGNNVKASLLPAFLPFIDAFKNQVRFLWFFNGDHLKFEILSFCHHSWEGFFADLALEFGEVVALNYAFNFFFDFAVNPGAKAAHVNQSAAPFALARGNQGVVVGLF